MGGGGRSLVSAGSVDARPGVGPDSVVSTYTPQAEPAPLISLTTGVLAALAAFALTRRYLVRRAERSALTDEAIRSIEERGTVDVDEPLDPGEADAEERRFWTEEQWDESEEW